ncbi:microprocessor complex subunit DGCR8 isoform X2 [Aplysia californica]|uniref:Microprocessor complex subunit DGCR8 isoform X2 n=1 Tax=Aplysia californica TaxID=6500 RepID=A0ABM0K5A0_APLCA|nr:microprocessor complex subunit DGCR8 isoform X2 [Aplysia californica]
MEVGTEDFGSEDVIMDSASTTSILEGSLSGEEENAVDAEENVDAGSDPGEDHEFEIIDQVESEEEGDEKDARRQKTGDDKEGEEDEFTSDSDLDDSELHAMLEKGIDKDSISANKGEEPAEGAPIIKHKIVLQELETDPFDILPPGWVCVTHNCGMPVYLHKESRVCTMARPYSLGSASTRNHDIPISAIPCLQYKRQIEKLCDNVEDNGCGDEQRTVEKKSQEVSEDGQEAVTAAGEAERCPLKVLKSPQKKIWCVSQESTSKALDHDNSGGENTVKEVSSVVAASDSSAAGGVDAALCQDSPQTMWVMSQGSFQKVKVGPQPEALHMGRMEYCSQSAASGDQYSGQTCKEKIHIPRSPGEANIAVSLDCSTILNDSEVVDSESTPTQTNKESLRVNGAEYNYEICAHDPSNTTSVKLAGRNQEENMGLSCQNEAKSQSGLGAVSGSSGEMGVKNEAPNSGDDGSGLEEGEIEELPTSSDVAGVDARSGEKIRCPVGHHSKDPTKSLVTSEECTSNNCVQSNFSSPEFATFKPTDAAVNGGLGNDDNAIVVREEASSSSEPSEIVTSQSNTLAAIKRKLESLKNRHGGKQRKLDGSGGSSATGWPTEHNLTVNVVKHSSPGDSTEAQNTANETLKAHAAEVKIKTAEERAKESLLNSDSLHSYCERLFRFKTIEVKKYRSWRERRKHIGEKIRKSRPELPSSTKLITCPILGSGKPDSSNPQWKKREFVLNPTGKSYLCILHEYMQRTLKIQPTYIFKELENSKTPYGATVTINNIEYGTGYASSKKVAKQEAAKETLKILIPDLFNKITDQEIKRNVSDLSFFDEIKVTDPRVNDLGNKVGQPSPYQLLLECLRRNFGMGNTQCNVSTQPLKNQKCEFSIEVGKHSATVVAKNKRDGKQLAAQAILAKLHPHVPSWGSLLRLYGTNMEKPVEKVEEMNEIKTHAPNHSVLESLKEEMRKLHKQKEAIQSKGKIIISSKDLPSKMSGVDL